MKNLSIEKRLPRKLKRLYILALSLVAIFLVVGQALIQVSITKQQSDSRVVNIAGRQRMLSQRLCKTSILLANPDIYMPDAEIYIQDLASILELWLKCHEGLKSGILLLETAIPVKNSLKIDSMFAAIDPMFSIMYFNAQEIKSQLESPTKAKNEIIKNALVKMLQNERSFLKTMDAIVFSYDIEAKQRIENLKKIEIFLFVVTLLILVVEGVFIFIPTYKQIDIALTTLVAREGELRTINGRLKEANLSVLNARSALLKATQETYDLEKHQDKLRNASLIKGQEEERKRIALELHDGIGQMLTGIKLISENMNDADFPAEKDRKTLSELKQLIADTIAETRVISFNLMPSVLNDFGVFSAIRMLLEQTKKSSEIHFYFVAPEVEFRINRNLEITLYRICQEAINNTLKHAKATEVNINIQINNDAIIFKYADNGIGFDVKKLVSKALKNGINNIKARTELCDGTVKILSAKGKGMNISIYIPVT